MIFTEKIQMFDLIVHREIRLDNPREGSCGHVRQHIRSAHVPEPGATLKFDDGTESAEILSISIDTLSCRLITLSPALYSNASEAMSAKEHYRRCNWVTDEDEAAELNVRYRF
jgi:hypothetical protein